jgi:NADH-quinone oxidoreductase subunit N
MVLVGFGFKVAAVPFHQWAPDAYEGAPAPVSAWIAAGSKLASFAALAKVLVEGLSTWGTRPGDYTAPGWVGILAILAAISMTYGNYAALVQKNLKRMLAYSSIAHAGYLLVGVLAASISISGRESMGSVLYYLIFYAFATAGGFALAAWLARDLESDEIDDLAGLGRREPLLGFSIVVLMLSLIGMPPLAGFFGKLFMFMEAINTRESDRLTMIWLVALGLFNSVVSAFYYVRVLKVMYLREPQAGRAPLAAPGVAVRWSIGVATLLVILFGLVPTPVIDSMKAASIQMLTPGNTLTPTAGRYSTQLDPTVDPKAAFEREKERNKGKRVGAAG